MRSEVPPGYPRRRTSCLENEVPFSPKATVFFLLSLSLCLYIRIFCALSSFSLCLSLARSFSILSVYLSVYSSLSIMSHRGTIATIANGESKCRPRDGPTVTNRAAKSASPPFQGSASSFFVATNRQAVNSARTRPECKMTLVGDDDTKN